MARRPRAAATFTIDGRRWTFALTDRRVAALEAELGVPAAQFAGTGWPGLLALVHGALLEHHPGLTREEAGALVDAAGLETLVAGPVQAAVRAWANSLTSAPTLRRAFYRPH